jgi:uncharacterized integral membrane protein (TIGR00697 family)
MKQNKGMYKYFTSLSMLYMTIKLITVLLIYKVIVVFGFSATASTLVMPFWFFLGDIITEVYGYKAARRLIWAAIFCQCIFALVCAGMIKLDSPIFWTGQAAYDQVLGKLPKVAFASSLAIMCGAFINAYALAKWKILLKGKYFWARSLGASSIGELIFTALAYLIEFSGIVPIPALVQLMMISFVVKLILGPLLVIPAMIITSILKKLEGIDVYDYCTNFNPFKLDIGDNQALPPENNIVVMPS